MSVKITVLAGEFVHRTTTQFRWLAERAPEGFIFRIVEGPEAFAQLEDADLFIAAGLYWTQSPVVQWTEPVPYAAPSEAQKAAFRRYLERGGPTLGFHGGIASFDDWPEFGALLGFAWHWDITTHGPFKEYRVYPADSGHDVIRGVEEFRVEDENYFNVQLQLGASYWTHLKMDCGDTQQPMLMTLDANPRGGGKSAYLGLGHDMRALENPSFPRIFWNTVRWLTDSDSV